MSTAHFETLAPHSIMSGHAKIRQQQRSIPDAVIDLLLDFGEETHLGGGVTSFSFRKKGWKRAARYLGRQAKFFERYRACYVVVAENGTIITVAYCY
jgi:hypothetical protein